ncbi:hypothetical protein FRC06_004892 [Ceratobasidium sp. 370]|nr:hypothetical protein FRC06_004892 [Ceratobasidium sp. 370]
MWNFMELCAYLKPLAEKALSDVDKIVFAREFKVAEWLAPAHARLCLREERITTQEAEKLGISSLLYISRFREENPRKFYTVGPAVPPIGSAARGYISAEWQQTVHHLPHHIRFGTMAKPNTMGATKPGNVEDVRPPPVFNRHPKFFFDNTLVAIGIEGTLFNVHKYQLMKSTTFSDMFAIAEEPKNGDTPQEGSSPDHPIVMEGVSASDFECLMTVLYASHFSAHQPEPEASLIIPAFRLANMWNFVELCAYLRPLAERALGDVDKIVFAREFQVTDWLAPAHVNLCLREKQLTTQEASKLGLDSLLFISRFREDHPREVKTARCPYGHTNIGYYPCGCSMAGQPNVPSPLPSEPEVKAKVQAWLDGGCVLSD